MNFCATFLHVRLWGWLGRCLIERLKIWWLQQQLLLSLLGVMGLLGLLNHSIVLQLGLRVHLNIVR